MKRITPNDIYRGLPCSVVAVGCAMQNTDADTIRRLVSDDLHQDGYLSLDGMNRLIRANLRVIRRVNYKRSQRPKLRNWAHTHPGQRAVVCVLGHYLYFDGRDYHSFFWNGGDPVVSVWYLDDVEQSVIH